MLPSLQGLQRECLLAFCFRRITCKLPKDIRVDESDSLALPNAETPRSPKPCPAQDASLMALPECQAPLMQLQGLLLPQLMDFAVVCLQIPCQTVKTMQTCRRAWWHSMKSSYVAHAAGRAGLSQPIIPDSLWHRSILQTKVGHGRAKIMWLSYDKRWLNVLSGLSFAPPCLTLFAIPCAMWNTKQAVPVWHCQ